MGVFEAIGSHGHEEVLFGSDPASGLRAIIAIHSTALGPALGGTRWYPYPSEDEALADALRLSEAMSYKAAAAGLDLGGGKAVIFGDPTTDRSERLLRAFGRLIDSLGGRYITAEDVGTTMDDMLMIARETQWVTGVPSEYGGSGDPSPATAFGVMAALRAVAEHLWGSDDLSDRTVAVQGVGKVGWSLVERLTKAGARVVVSDVRSQAAERAASTFGAETAPAADIYDVRCDVLAPCALGGGLNEATIPRLTCAAVAGAANNQLATEADADRLADAGILYVPDFVVNAGGIINITEELRGYSPVRAERALDRIHDNVQRVLAAAERRGVNPHVAAVAVARERIDAIGGLAVKRRAGVAHGQHAR